jgi:chitin disaccharide deacetylase
MKNVRNNRAPRRLLVIADDFGIGFNTTTGILQLAAKGLLTGSALIVNTSAAAESVQRWRNLGGRLELGWHPNLTLDSPLAEPSQVPSLIRDDGTFWPLGAFLQRWWLGKLDPAEIALELHLQLRRYIQLVGHPPTFVNFHQHLALFKPIGAILLDQLSELHVKPYVRRVQEPWPLIAKLGGARLKRAFLNRLGRRASNMQRLRGFPGNDWLAGIARPSDIADPQFFLRWLRATPGDIVELMCHPGLHDPSLIGRDCTESDGLLDQRVNEMRWLFDPTFVETLRNAGFQLTAPSELLFDARALALCS